MSYFINVIEGNKYNQYKYHYLDHMCCVIDMRENYWSFAVDLYSINNFSMPVNTIAGDLQLPYQQVKDITFNLATDQSRAKIGVEHNVEYSKIYSGNFNVDISQNEFLKQDLNNIKLNLELNLYVDPEAAKGAGSQIQQDVLDSLMKETSEQRWDFSLYYSNTQYIKQSSTIDNITGYDLPFGKECIARVKPIQFDLDDYANLSSPFNNLAKLSSLTTFQVLTGKVKFHYWIEVGTEEKIIEKVLTVDRKLSNELAITLDDYTIYDYEKDEVKFDPIGAEGFYIPKYSSGYYELELMVSQDDTINKFIITNHFNFIKNIGKPVMAITHKLINNIDDFKEVIF